MATTNDRVLSHFLRFLNEERMSARGKQIVEDARGCSLADFGISSVEAMELVKDSRGRLRSRDLGGRGRELEQPRGHDQLPRRALLTPSSGPARIETACFPPEAALRSCCVSPILRRGSPRRCGMGERPLIG